MVVYSRERSPNFSCTAVRRVPNCTRWRENIPCSLVRPSVPWRRVGRSSHQYPDGQQQPHPVTQGTNISPGLESSTHQPRNTYHSEVLERSSLLDVLQRLLQILQLDINTALGLLGALDSLHLEGLNRLDLSGEVVRRGLEGLEVLLDLVDDGLVLQDRAVVREVDGRRLLRQRLHPAAGIFVALLERLEGGYGLPAETERAGHLVPVELEGCTTLQET